MFSARQLIEIIFRHKKKIVFVPLLSMLLGAAVLLFFPRTYQSEARIFLRVGRESVGLDPTATTGRTMSALPGDRKDEVKSAVDVLGSRGVAAQAVDLVGPKVVLGRAGVGATPTNLWVERLRAPIDKFVGVIASIDPISEREEAIVTVEKNLIVSARRDSTVINVAFKAKSPQLAQSICSAIVQVYEQEHLRIFRSEESRPFFSEQRDRLRRQLDVELAQVRDAKNELGASRIDERCSTLEAQFGAIELERFRTRQELVTTQARVADLKEQLDELPERLVDTQRSVPNDGADLLRDQLYALEMKAMDLEARYSDSHPLVQAIKNQLEDARQVMATQTKQRLETTDAVNPIYRTLLLSLKQEKSVMAGLEARLTELQQQKTLVLADLKAVNDLEIKIDQLERRASLARSKYFQYAQNLEEARMDRELEHQGISNISVLQAATFAEKPVSPNKLMVVLAAVVLAAAGTTLLVVLSERLGDKLRTELEIAEALGVPVFATIPNGRDFNGTLRARANGHVRRPQVAAPVPRR